MTTISLVLIAVGGTFTAFNWLCLYASWSSRQYVSPVCPAASVLTAIGLACDERTRPFFWVGLLTDWTLFALLAVSPRLAAEAWRTSRFTRVRSLRADDPPRRFRLTLHRGGHFLLRATFHPPMPCDEHGASIAEYGNVGRWQEFATGGIRLTGYAEDRTLLLEPSGEGFLAREFGYPRDQAFPFDSLDNLTFRETR